MSLSNTNPKITHMQSQKNINNINISIDSIGSDLVWQVAIRLLLLFVFMASLQDRENGSEPETVKGEIPSPVEDDCSEVKVESPELLEQFRLAGRCWSLCGEMANRLPHLLGIDEACCFQKNVWEVFSFVEDFTWLAQKGGLEASDSCDSPVEGAVLLQRSLSVIWGYICVLLIFCFV